MERTLIAAVLASMLGCSTGANAQESWPNRPLTMVVPFAAGGPVDVLGRILGQYLGEAVGRQVIIDNVTGAGGMAGSLKVSQATQDGLTFVLGSIGTHALNQTLYKRPLYNAATDFAPVALIADVPLVLLARKDLPASDLGQFIGHAKARQSSMQFGSGGAGTSSHIGCVLLNQTIGVDVTHIPYRGGGPALIDLIAGRVDYVCNLISTAVPPVEAGQVKPIATLSRERSKVLPNLATAHEQGLKDFDGDGWNAFFFPPGTPDAIVQRLAKVTSEILDGPAIRERLEGLGLSVAAPERRMPEYLAKLVRSDLEKWAAPVKASGAVEE
jgi:tripartite-type tricarboxylate transporter receptor subunit TctC